MVITGPLLLSPDVVLLPVADLPEEVRRKLDPEEGEWAVTHPRSRAPSRVVDAQAAELLREFQTPRTIVEAVIRFSQARGFDPEATLEQAYPLLERLVKAGVLVAEGSEEAAGVAPALWAGDRYGGYEVVEPLQVMEDAEVYLVQGGEGFAVLKTGRGAGEALDREAAVLAHLGGTVAPRLVPSPPGPLTGRGEDLPEAIVLEWFPGVDSAAAAAELRERDPEGLLALCRSVLEAYAFLHRGGVVHGDVHPRNILVGREEEVRLIDFGLARWEGVPGSPRRGGVGFFYEPEAAEALLAGRPLPEATPAGEQYAVAAVLYLLITGAHTHDFKLTREAMMRQIAEEPPRPLSGWPEAAGVLARALAKAPEDRFASMADFAAAFSRLAPPSVRPAGRSRAEALLARVLDLVGMEGPLFRNGLPEPPRASVTYGAAGIACGLRRIALARENAEILSLADLWAERAARETGDAAYYRDGGGLDRASVGRITPYYTASGVHAVRAQIAHALGDAASLRQAVDAFVATAGGPCLNPDLTLGRSGVLLASALLLELLDSESLRELGNRLMAELWEDFPESPNLGMAHGQAGYLYATLRWCRAAGRPVPGSLPARLAELASQGRPWGRGTRWLWYGEDGRSAGSMPGWCNGSAGFVFLWTLAARMLEDRRWPALAEGAAWNTWEASDGQANLCCGLAGRAYALLHLYRHGGGPEWLERARLLADRAALAAGKSADPPYSLYKGDLGIAVLAADLTQPEEAAMPFFEEEGWS